MSVDGAQGVDFARGISRVAGGEEEELLCLPGRGGGIEEGGGEAGKREGEARVWVPRRDKWEETSGTERELSVVAFESGRVLALLCCGVASAANVVVGSRAATT